MRASLCLDELLVNAHAVAALDAPFQNVARVQVAPDLLEINDLAFVREGRATLDDERAAMRERSVVWLSVTPSTKYSCSGPPPRLWRGVIGFAFARLSCGHLTRDLPESAPAEVTM